MPFTPDGYDSAELNDAKKPAKGKGKGKGKPKFKVIPTNKPWTIRPGVGETSDRPVPDMPFGLNPLPPEKKKKEAPGDGLSKILSAETGGLARPSGSASSIQLAQQLANIFEPLMRANESDSGDDENKTWDPNTNHPIYWRNRPIQKEWRLLGGQEAQDEPDWPTLGGLPDTARRNNELQRERVKRGGRQPVLAPYDHKTLGHKTPPPEDPALAQALRDSIKGLGPSLGAASLAYLANEGDSGDGSGDVPSNVQHPIHWRTGRIQGPFEEDNQPGRIHGPATNAEKARRMQRNLNREWGRPSANHGDVFGHGKEKPEGGADPALMESLRGLGSNLGEAALAYLASDPQRAKDFITQHHENNPGLWSQIAHAAGEGVDKTGALLSKGLRAASTGLQATTEPLQAGMNALLRAAGMPKAEENSGFWSAAKPEVRSLGQIYDETSEGQAMFDVALALLGPAVMRELAPPVIDTLRRGGTAARETLSQLAEQFGPRLAEETGSVRMPMRPKASAVVGDRMAPNELRGAAAAAKSARHARLQNVGRYVAEEAEGLPQRTALADEFGYKYETPVDELARQAAEYEKSFGGVKRLPAAGESSATLRSPTAARARAQQYLEDYLGVPLSEIATPAEIDAALTDFVEKGARPDWFTMPDEGVVRQGLPQRQLPRGNYFPQAADAPIPFPEGAWDPTLGATADATTDATTDAATSFWQKVKPYVTTGEKKNRLVSMLKPKPGQPVRNLARVVAPPAVAAGVGYGLLNRDGQAPGALGTGGTPSTDTTTPELLRWQAISHQLMAPYAAKVATAGHKQAAALRSIASELPEDFRAVADFNIDAQEGLSGQMAAALQGAAQAMPYIQFLQANAAALQNDALRSAGGGGDAATFLEGLLGATSGPTATPSGEASPEVQALLDRLAQQGAQL